MEAIMAENNSVQFLGGASNSPVDVFDRQSTDVLNNIYKYLQNQSKEINNKKSNSDNASVEKSIEKLVKTIEDSSDGNSNQDGFDNIADGITKLAQDNRISEREVHSNNRAVQKALSGIVSNQKASARSDVRKRADDQLFGRDIKKKLGAFDVFKKGLMGFLDGLKSFLGDHLSKSLKAQSDMAKMMRKQNLTRSEKNEIMAMSNKAQQQAEDLFGIKLDTSDISSFYEELIAGGKDLKLMGDDQRAAYAALRKSGIDDAKAYELAMSASKESVAELTRAATDPKTKAMIAGQLNSLKSTELMAVGVDKAIRGSINGAVSMASRVGNAGLASATENLKNNLLAANGVLEGVDASRVAAMGGIVDPSKMGDQYEKMINSLSEGQVRAMALLDGPISDIANDIAKGKNISDKGNKLGSNPRSDEENAEALSQNTVNGTAVYEIQKAFGKFDTLTGGMLGKGAVIADELFGDDMDMSKIVSTGFKIITTLLTSIVGSDFIKKGINGFTSLLPVVFKGIFNKSDKSRGASKSELSDISSLKGLASKSTSKLDNNEKPKKEPRDLNKEYAEAANKIKDDASKAWKGIKSIPGNIKEGIKSIPGNIQSVASKTVDSVKSISGSIKDGASKAWDSVKSGASKAFDGIKSVPGLAKQSFVNMAKRGVIAFSKIPDAFSSFKKSASSAFSSFKTSVKSTFKSMKDSASSAFKKLPGALKGAASKVGKASKAVGKGIGITAGVVGLLGSTGAFDSLTPILEDFSKTMVPVLSNLVNTLAPTIKSLLDTLGPALAGTVNALAPVLDGVLKALTPILTNIIQALVPVLDSVFKALAPVLETVIQVLTPVIDTLIQTLLPIFTSLVETLMPVVKTILDVLTPILQTVLDVVGPVIKSIATILTPVLKVIGTVLKAISPVLTFVLKPIAAALEFITMPLQLVAKLLGDENKGKDASEASDAAQAALEAGDEETAARARAVQVGYSKGESKIDREEGESDRSYYARAYKEMYGDKENITDESNYEQQILDELKKGVEAQDNSWFGIGDNFLDKDINSYWRELADDSIVEKLAEAFGYKAPYNDTQKKYLKESLQTLVPDRANKIIKKEKLANGGVFSQATDATIGEDGKEVVLPLTKPDRISSLLQELTSNERLLLINSLLQGKNLLGILENVFSGKEVNTRASEQEQSEYTAALAKLEAWQGGKLKPADFIAMFGPIAREDMRATGIPAAITIAQAALESGWGKSARADFRNLFGIKGTGDAGSKVIPTHEFTAAGERYNKNDTFAQYSSYLASINAHSQYLLTAKRKKGLGGLRYGEALLYTGDSDMFAHKIKEAGYATSPNYAEKLIGLMKQYDLYKYNVSGVKPTVQGVKAVASNIVNNTVNAVKSFMGIKPTESVDLADGSVVAANMITGAREQMGKKYAEMVCNQMVEAAMKWAGLTPPTTGPVFKHFNHPNMHLILNDPEHGISPNDPKLRPGMILFSHPFTQAEADDLNRTKGKGRKAGDPGHMGIYAGKGLWWNSTSSKNTVDYSSGTGVRVTDSNKGFGVALTKPFTTGTYKLYAAGYYDGMYDAADTQGLSETSPKELKDTEEVTTEDQNENVRASELRHLMADAVQTILGTSDEKGDFNRRSVDTFLGSIDRVADVANSEYAREIVKYLREIVNRMSKVKVATPAAPARTPTR